MSDIVLRGIGLIPCALFILLFLRMLSQSAARHEGMLDPRYRWCQPDDTCDSAADNLSAKCEMIGGVAIQMGTSVIAMPPPNRHHNVIRLMVDTYGFHKPITGTQGFVTNTGRFVDRIEGLAIAKAANQLKPNYIERNELYSEDVW